MATPQQLVQYLVSKGMSPIGATGLVARWQQESGQQLNPTAIGDRSIPGASQGIGQWNRERLTNLRAFGGDAWTDPFRQADFALAEMGIAGDKSIPGYGSEATAGNMFRTAASPEQAVAAGMAYERPQGWTAGNPAAGHGYGNTMRNYSVLAGGSIPQRPNATSPQMAADMASPGNPAMQPPAPVDPHQGPNLPTENPYAAVASPAGDKKGWRNALSKAMAGFKLPNVAKSDTALGGMASPAAARVDTPEMPTFDQNQIAQQRQDLALAMQRLNTGRLWG